MRRISRAGAWLLTAGLLLAATGGCGGSSDACPPTDADRLAGTYHVAARAAQLGAPLTERGEWGRLTLEGDGELAIETTVNEIGQLSSYVASDGLAFDVGLDRTVTVGSAAFFGIPFLAGGASTDRSLIVLTSEGIGPPQLQILTRRGARPDPTSLAGTFYLCGSTYDLALSRHTGWFGTLTLDATGGGTIQGFLNREGLSGGFGPDAVSASVEADGTVTMDLGPGGVVEGAVSKGDDVIVLSGSTASLGNPALFAMVRQASFPGVDSFDGAFHLAGFELDAGSGERRALHGTLFVQASSQTVFSAVLHHQETWVEQNRLAGTFKVETDGRLSITATSGGDDLLGAVSPGGDVAILWRGGLPGVDPTFWIAVR